MIAYAHDEDNLEMSLYLEDISAAAAAVAGGRDR